jgi:hypothetical protein
MQLLLTLSYGVSWSAAHSCFAQSFVELTGGYYGQDFDDLATEGAANFALPKGFTLIESGPNADGAYAPFTGSESAGNTYSFGTDEHRALGEITSEGVQSIFGAGFINRTGAPLRRFSVGFVGEQWRLGAADGVSDYLSFQYSIDATNLTTGTWTTLFNLESRVNDGPVGALNGHGYQSVYLPSLRTLPTAIPEGGMLFVRWVGTDIAGEDDGLAVSFFSLRTFPTADFDQDGDVDGRDFLTWQRNVGKTHSSLYQPGDASGDAQVDGGDLSVWKRQFVLPATTTTAVPEPAGLMPLAALAMLLALRPTAADRRPVAPLLEATRQA